MSDDVMRERLSAAIKAAGKSSRAVSLAAGLGPGYVHSILKEGKDPTIEKLIAVCDAIPVSVIHILHGVDALPEDIEILRALQSSPDTRQAILAILRVQKAS